MSSDRLQLLIVGEFGPPIADAISDIAGIEIHTAANFQDAQPIASKTDILLCTAPMLTEHWLSAAVRLRWIQSLTSGTDAIERLTALRSSVVLTSARGVHGPQVSELVLLYMLALLRDFDRMRRDQEERRWERRLQPLLWQKTVVIIGLGTIAEALALRCKALEMRVVGVSRRSGPIANIDVVVAPDALCAAVASADFVVVLAPYSAQTHHLVDHTVLSAMQPHAFLINVARGSIVDEAALVKALSDRSIAGAGLDVFEEEPLPVAHPLWGLDNVMLTPHLGGASDVYARQLTPLVRANLQRFLAGDIEGLQNKVEPQHSK